MKRDKKTIRRRQKEKRSFAERVSNILLWMFEIAVAVLFAFVLVYFLGNVRTNIGQSMDTTLSDGDKVLINTLTYRLGDPKRNDLIAFKPNGSSTANTHIKRVIGLPGETVQIMNGMIYINGKVFLERNSYSLMNDAGLAEEPVQLGPTEYFVLGDNRNNSEDSRYADIGLVDVSFIEGRVWMRIAPSEAMGFVR